MTMQANLRAPWKLLAKYLPDLEREPALFGACYLAKGTFKA